jgi:THUMP domain-like/RNA cap guanine-N2 methyltransferase
MTSRELPAGIPRTDEVRLMQELRAHPELFAQIASHQGPELSLQKKLRETFAPELVSASIQLAELRERGTAKFSQAPSMWFDRTGLEQATPESVAQHKARRFSGAVLDLCSGIGGDSIALARHCDVTSLDLNPAACLRCWWNAEVYGVQENLQVECGPAELRDAGNQLVHLDPDRRPGSGGRTVRLEDAVPGLPFLRELIGKARGGAIKMSPAANFIGKFPDAELELISLHGECKEATLWFGELSEPGLWRATALPAGESLAGNPLDAWAETSEPQQFVFDPDPAIVRAGMIDLLAEQLNLSRLDDAEEYLTGPKLIESPFVRAFEVLDVLPYKEKELRRYFREAEFGQLEIKCRHIRVPIETLRKKLRLEGDRPGVLIVARVTGISRAIICRRV